MFTQSQDRAAAATRVKQWTRARFGEVTVLVSEVESAMPGFPPISEANRMNASVESIWNDRPMIRGVPKSAMDRMNASRASILAVYQKP